MEFTLNFRKKEGVGGYIVHCPSIPIGMDDIDKARAENVALGHNDAMSADKFKKNVTSLVESGAIEIILSEEEARKSNLFRLSSSIPIVCTGEYLCHPLNKFVVKDWTWEDHQVQFRFEIDEEKLKSAWIAAGYPLEWTIA
jgi:hypothetical protein